MDKTLKALAKKIPLGWSMFINEDNLVIEKEKEIYQVFENKINMCVSLSTPSEEEVLARLKKEGKRVKCKFIFPVEAKWKKSKRKSVIEFNGEVEKNIQGLRREKKEKLGYKMKMRKGYEFFANLTPEEEDWKKGVEEKLSNLQRSLKKLPRYATEKYFIFEEYGRHEGFDDEFHTSYSIDFPKKDNTKNMYEVDNIIQGVLSPVNLIH